MNLSEKQVLFNFIYSKLDINSYNEAYIDQVIQHQMSVHSLKSYADYLAYLEDNPGEINVIQSNLSNSYSCFFRNRYCFETIRNVLLPVYHANVIANQDVRIWSVACAGGHEAYSLAMLFESFNQANSTKLKYRIFATDKIFSEIEKAVIGVYSKPDIANLTFAEIDTWLVKTDLKYKLNPELKKNIQFELFDLLQNEIFCPKSSIFGSFDIIMCANVLFYYNEHIQQKIISGLVKSLSKTGYIITGEIERSIFLKIGFTEVIPYSCIFKK